MSEAINWVSKRVTLIEAGINFITEFVDWKAKAIYFLDNNGNIVEFITREDLNNNSD